MADVKLPGPATSPRTTAIAVSRLSQASGTQGCRRDHHRHARPLAGADLHPRLPGRQGHLRRKAAEPDDSRRPADGRGRPQIQARLSGRQPAAIDGGQSGGLQVHSRGQTGQDQEGHRDELSEPVVLRLAGRADSGGARLGLVVRPDAAGAVPSQILRAARQSRAGSLSSRTPAAR